MRAERFNRLHDLFESAIELDHDSRRGFFKETCGDDTALSQELVSLLRTAEQPLHISDPFSDRRIDQQRARLDRMLDSALSNDLPADHLGLKCDIAWRVAQRAKIGRFRITRRIASGGMGTVYQAEQDNPRRTVALKMVHAQRTSPAVLDRLQREADILARLQHPGIAQIFDADQVDLGDGLQPYFAMEYVDGVTLTEYCDREQFDVRRRLELLALVGDAVQYAHDQGVIHRDLKPGNILVDAAGRPKILDFGVALVTSDSTWDAATMSRAGQIIGTLDYMAPEQIEGRGESTQHADVYALGVIGFELLAGRLPHDLAGMSAAASLHYLVENDPPPLGAINPRYRGDVQTITDTALEREPRRRYESAAALAADIRRYLAHETIVARPAKLAYRARRFVRRNATLVGGAATVAVVLIAGIIVSTTFAVRAGHARAETESTLAELAQIARYQETQLAGIDADMMGDRLRIILGDELRKRLEQEDRPAGEIESALADLDEALAGINLADVASITLNENILERSRESIDDQFADQPLVRARLLLTLGKTMLRFGVYSSGEAAILECLRVRRALLGEKHPDTLAAASAAGRALALCGGTADQKPPAPVGHHPGRTVLFPGHP